MTVAIGLAATAVLAAALAGPCLAQPAGAPRANEGADATIAAQIGATEAALEHTRAELARLHASRDDLAASLQRIERRAEVHALGRELAQTMIDLQRRLPRRAQFAAARAERNRLLEATSDANFRVERMLGRPGDLDAAQRESLTRLDALQGQLMQALRETGQAERDLLARSAAARAQLTQYLFWLPARPGARVLTELGPSAAWTLSPANWRAVGAVLRDEALRRPFWPAACLLLAVGILAARGRLHRALVARSPAALGYGRYHIGHSLAALAITFALALPAPLLLGTAALLLASAPAAQPFPAALGDALRAITVLVLALTVLARLLDRHGVAIEHFGWNEAPLVFAARTVRRFAAFFVPLMFVAALNGLDHAPYANRESLGRLAFLAGMLVLAGFLVMLLRRRSPLLQPLVARSPRSWPVQLHAVWLGALVALPLGIAALAAAGYFTAASFFFGRLVRSFFLVLGALSLYGLIALWVRIQRARLDRQQGAGEGLHAPLDVAAIGEETRSLLNLLTTLLVLGGVWWLWKDAVPALSVIGDYRLWSYSETVGDKEVVRPLTVGHLSLAILVGAVTAVAVRNVGALLDIVLLQRIEMQADATYAIKVIARYALAAAGVVAASSVLGIGWSDVQWLVAALGVGLGFGLQEIFANLVSGLIVLTERPIRIGDVVTVGDVTGRVARIRARATTVVDFDNKEVLIPNKSFITDRVINWTLSDQTTRLLIKIGAPPGTDIALAQRVMLEAVRRNPGVLRSPEPEAFFTGFGASTLDFEIHAFVDGFDKRLRVQQEINLALGAALREHGIELAPGQASTAGPGGHGS